MASKRRKRAEVPAGPRPRGWRVLVEVRSRVAIEVPQPAEGAELSTYEAARIAAQIVISGDGPPLAEWDHSIPLGVDIEALR